MCVDNPRQGFGELFDTHPTVESRVAALVKFAGGHDRGPIALLPVAEGDSQSADRPAASSPWQSSPPNGPWGPKAENGASGVTQAETGGGSGQSAGPWGPHSRG